MLAISGRNHSARLASSSGAINEYIRTYSQELQGIDNPTREDRKRIVGESDSSSDKSVELGTTSE